MKRIMWRSLGLPVGLALLSCCVQAQNVGINQMGSTPSTNAILDLNTGNANNVGLIIPNVTLGATLAGFKTPAGPMANIANATDVGMMVYNTGGTQAVGYYYWSGTTWVSVSGGAAGYILNQNTAAQTANFWVTGPAAIGATYSATDELLVSQATAANIGILGQNTAAAGASTGIGVEGITGQSGGYGIEGINTATTGTTSAIYGVTANTTSALAAIEGNNTATTGAAVGVEGNEGALLPYPAPFIGPSGVYGSGQSNDGTGVLGYFGGNQAQGKGVTAFNNSTSNGGEYGLYAFMYGNTVNGTNVAVWASAVGTALNNYGGTFSASGGTTNNYGITGAATGPSTTAYGGYFSASSGTTNYGVYSAIFSAATINYGGYFSAQNGTTNCGIQATPNALIGVPSNTQGSLILANTVAGNLNTTIVSSNVATAAYTLTLPPAGAAATGYVLGSNGAGGTLQWINPGATGGYILNQNTAAQTANYWVTGPAAIGATYSATDELLVSQATAANIGILGQNTAAAGSGTGIGVEGITAQSSGYGVFGNNTSTLNFAIGVFGTANNSPGGIGVEGSSNLTAGTGAEGLFSGTGDGTGVLAVNAATGNAIQSGLKAEKTGNNGTGVGYAVYGLASGTSSNNYGGNFSATGASTTNYGVSSVASGAATSNIGGDFTASGATTNYGVNSLTSGAATNNFAGSFTALGATTNYGVSAVASGAATTNYAGNFQASGATNNFACYGLTFGAATTNYGGYYQTSGATTNYGMYALTAGAATTNYGGYFNASGGTTNYGIQATPNVLIGIPSGAQGSLILANTALGNFNTTIVSSNVATAAYTLTLPPGGAAATDYVLGSNGAGGTLQWINPGAAGGYILNQNTTVQTANFWISGNAAIGNSGNPANQLYVTTTNGTFDGVAGLNLAAAGAGGGTGVQGSTAQSNGYGVLATNSNASGAAILGNNTALSGTGIGIGVEGWTNQSGGYGVYGNNTSTSNGAVGVYGTANNSAAGVGVEGSTLMSGSAGVEGYADGAGTETAIVAENSSPAASQETGLYALKNGNNAAGIGIGISALAEGTATTNTAGEFIALGATTTNTGGLFQADGPATTNYAGTFNAQGAPTNYGVNSEALGTATNNYGGSFVANGATTTNNGVSSVASGTATTNYAGNFQATGATTNFAYYGVTFGAATVNYGGYYQSSGATTNYGMFALTAGAATTNYGGRFAATGATTNIGGYFTSSQYGIIVPAGGGNVGIGCATPPLAYEFYVAGNVGVVGNITASGTITTAAVTACSDIRYKKDITNLPDALASVMKLRGVNYYFKTTEFPDKHFGDGIQVGFIAQELERVYPEMVFTDEKGYKSVDYSRLTPVLVEAMKQQQHIIDSLTISLNTLHTEVSANREKDNQTFNARIDAQAQQIAELKQLIYSMNKVEANTK